MADIPSWQLVVVNPLSPFEGYIDDDLERLGYERSGTGEREFNKERVFVSFRISFQD
jgi:hypothetical protein